MLGPMDYVSSVSNLIECNAVTEKTLHSVYKLYIPVRD